MKKEAVTNPITSPCGALFCLICCLIWLSASALTNQTALAALRQQQGDNLSTTLELYLVEKDGTKRKIENNQRIDRPAEIEWRITAKTKSKPVRNLKLALPLPSGFRLSEKGIAINGGNQCQAHYLAFDGSELDENQLEKMSNTVRTLQLSCAAIEPNNTVVIVYRTKTR